MKKLLLLSFIMAISSLIPQIASAQFGGARDITPVIDIVIGIPEPVLDHQDQGEDSDIIDGSDHNLINPHTISLNIKSDLILQQNTTREITELESSTVVEVSTEDKNTSESESKDEDTTLESLTSDSDNFGFHLKAYPNPAIDQLSLDFDRIGNYEIYVFNMVGQLEAAYQALATNQHQIEVSDWQTGLYFLQVVENDQVYTKRIKVAH